MPFLLMGTFSLIAAVIISKIKSRVVVFTYEYLSLINLVLLPDPYDRQDSSHPFVHAKIFVIDKSILYTGSLNFTRAGMYSNIETRIRIDNKKEIARIYETIISYKNSLNAYHLDQICKSLYHEPVN
jgi:phosphatidylserine/phosphatidylglycerophosphate/cardiolipin synthase-like enzyme